MPPAFLLPLKHLFYHEYGFALVRHAWNICFLHKQFLSQKKISRQKWHFWKLPKIVPLPSHGAHKKWSGAFVLLFYMDIFVVEALVRKVFGCISSIATRHGRTGGQRRLRRRWLHGWISDSGHSPGWITGRFSPLKPVHLYGTKEGWIKPLLKLTEVEITSFDCILIHIAMVDHKALSIQRWQLLSLHFFFLLRPVPSG